MLTITKIKLHNFKRFRDLTLDVNPEINILIGDNESGKSTILKAIDFVARGSRTRIENIGLDKLFNVDAMNEFMKSSKSINDIPEMYVELYFENQPNEALEGINNSLNKYCSGIKLRCRLNDEYSKSVSQLLRSPEASFPLEFYSIVFETFAGNPFNAYTKKLNSLFIDNSTIGNPYAMREYVNDIFRSQLTDLQRVNTRHAYKDSKIQFQNKTLAKYNDQISPYSFAIRDSSDANIETDITLVENNIPLENKGAGTQCFIKTQLSLNKVTSDIDTVLIEEPENHLSYMKMLKLINLIRESQNRQIFISTHSNLIATRLNMRNCILLNSSSTDVCSLSSLNEDTAKFFMKAPDNNLLQFVLSPKSILVEGDAEFILMECLYEQTLNKKLSESHIGIIAVDGTCFKRYLDIAKILKNKVAVITDNDKDYNEKITKNYSDYTNNQFPNIRIFSEVNNSRYTFEVCIYEDNKEICDEEFTTPRRKLQIIDFMLENKTEAAYRLLKNRANTLVVPDYIQKAIKWIDE